MKNNKRRDRVMTDLKDCLTGFHSYCFKEIYSQPHNALLVQAEPVFDKSIPIATDFFYEQLMANDDSAKFLSTELVQTRLKNDLTAWLKQLLSPKAEPDEIVRVIEAQRHVGEVHARINIPMELVSTSMFFIKHTFFTAVYEAGEPFNSEDKIQLILLIDSLLMNSLNLINEVYLKDVVKHKRAALDYQYHSSPKDTALEIVKIKSKLYNWLADYFGYMTSVTPGMKFPEAEANECGLWITHKLPLIAKNKGPVEEIQALLHKLQREIRSRDRDDMSKHVGQVRSLVKEINFLLSALSEKIIKESEQQDGLTNLISRRYLAPIIQSETQTALRTQTRYAVVMMDIDDFKVINDQYGHLTGDKVLLEVGRIAKEEIRISDYAFRYGGEEFLLLLPECDLEEAVNVAEKVRQKVCDMPIEAGDAASISVTCSLGVAEFTDHPDYMTVIKAADDKLYESKHKGKNCTSY